MALSDENMIKRCLDGDDGAFGFIVDKYKGAVHALAYRKTGNYHDAEEIAQETFLKAYQKLSTLKYPSRLAGWLYVICANCCYSWLRKRRNEKRAVTPLEQLSRGEMVRFSYARYIDQQTDQSVREAVNGLPESERTVVTLHYLGGLSCKEISRFLGVSLSTAKMRLYRARKQLRKEMTGMLEQTWGRSQLGSGFTFQLVDMIRKISPLSPPGPAFSRWIPVGAIAATLMLSFGSLFTSSTTPLLDVATEQENVRVTLLTLPQLEGQAWIYQPVAITPVNQGGKSGLDNNSQVGEMSALALLNDVSDERKSEETFSIKGVVLRDGAPEAGVLVYALMDNVPQANTLSGSDGKYGFAELPMHEDGWLYHYKLLAHVDREQIGWARLTEYCDLESVEVHLYPTRSITGAVKDRDGQPVEGADVHVTKMQWGDGSSQARVDLPIALPLFQPAMTDANGSFVIHNMPAGGSVDVRVEKEGYALFSTHQNPIEAPLNITLRPASTIEGRVIDSVTGRPVEGVLLECRGRDTNAFGFDTTFVVETRSGADGSYRFDNLPPDDYTIRLAEQLPGRTFGQIGHLVVGPLLGRHVGLDVELVEGGVISGKIMTRDGKPVSNKAVSFYLVGWRRQRVLTDEEGEYRFRSIPGKVKITPPSNCIPAKTNPGDEFEIVEGTEIDSVDYVYVGISVSGMVLTTDGTPVAGAIIYDETPIHPKAPPTSSPRARSRADGTFALKGDFLEGKELKLAAEKASEGLRGEVTFTVAPDIPAEITVLENVTGNVHGSVVDESGAPIPGVLVRLARHTEGSSSWKESSADRSLTDAEGRFESEALRVGRLYELIFEKEGYQGKFAGEFEMTAGEMDLGEITLMADERATGNVKGVVVGLDGRPIAGTIVTTVDGQYELLTDANGEFQMLKLRDNPLYELQIFGRKGTDSRQIIFDLPLNLPKLRFVMGKYDQERKQHIHQRSEFYRLIGEEAPPLHIARWIMGTEKPLEELRDKDVFLCFWADWCDPSAGILHELNRLWQRYNEHIAVICIHESTPDVEKLTRLVQWMNIPLNICIDDEEQYAPFLSATFREYYICGIPTIVHIDRSGKFMGEVDIDYTRRIVEQGASTSK